MKTRLTAFAWHFVISAAVMAIALAVIYFLWYPGAFSYVQEVTTIVLMLTAIDVVMGPLLTFVVYKPAKKSLKFDLAMIGLLQVAALAYGMLTVYQARPVYAVYSEGQFATVSAFEYENRDLFEVSKDNPYLDYSTTGPRWIGAVMPPSATPNEREMVALQTALGVGLRVKPRYYVPYETMMLEAAGRARRASEIDLATAAANPSAAAPGPAQLEVMRAALEGFGMPLDQIGLLPLRGSRQYGTVALERKSGRILGTIPVAPFWK